MGWTDRWVWGNEGRGPNWWEVAFWAGPMALIEVALIGTVRHDNGAVAFLVTVSAGSWIWGLRGLRPPKPPTDDP